jgi:peptidoglycan/LPS O-acetylase OafA/YrhL
VQRGMSVKAMLRRFYRRRSFRILPLYLGSILNFYRLRSGYVNNDFFSHFWSLSVEE